MKSNNKIAFLGALLLCLGSFTQVVAAAEDYLGNSVETLGFFPNVVLGANNAKKAKKERRKMKKERKKAEAAASRAEAAAARAEESSSIDEGFFTPAGSDADLSRSDSGDANESSSMNNADEAAEAATGHVVAAPVDNGAEAATAQLGEAAEDDSNTEAAIEAGDVNVDGTEDPVLGEEAAGLKATLSAKLNGAKVFVTTNVAALWAAVKSPKTSIIDPAISYTKNNPYRVVPVAGGVAIVTGAGIYFYVYPNEWTKFKSWVKEKAAYVFG